MHRAKFVQRTDGANIFAERRLIRPKFVSPCQTNCFTNHESSYVFDLPDTFGGFVVIVVSILRKKDTVIVATYT